MATALITHPDCLGHETPDGHPERVARLRHVLRALEAEAFQDLIRVEAPRVERAAVARAHDAAMLDGLEKAAPQEGSVAAIDPDTWLSAGSLDAAARAAGATVLATDMVLDGEVGNAFCAVRPPGHHAERDAAMGFCLHNNVAVAALHALEARGLSRVAILDFDVHHGNGSQDVFWDDPRVLVASSHEWPLYPGKGAETETGAGDNILNVHLKAGDGSAPFRAVWSERILPRVRAHKPELIFISAGFDAHVADPLANLQLTERDFAWVTTEICMAARDLCGAKVVSSLEGGYDLAALARSAAAHVEALTAASLAGFA